MAPSHKFRNRLLNNLSPGDRGLLLRDLEAVSLPVKRVMEKPHVPIDHVYFVETGVISVVAIGGKGRQIEIGLVGYEGMTGTTVILGGDRTPNTSYVQIAGEGHRIRSSTLRKAMAASPSLSRMLLRFTQYFMVQTSQTAIANGLANLDERLARWLLMAHDRIGSDVLPLTHQFLSIMLGVRRAGVTEAIAVLEGRGLIGAKRGEVLIRDREGLEQCAALSYGIPEAAYRRLLGGRRRGSDQKGGLNQPG
jgi:CRP-like cAMP-binding protein